MITMEYCMEGEAISDFEVEAWVDAVIDQERKAHFKHYKVTNSIPFSAIRLAIVQGRIPCENVTFFFDGKEIRPNKYGAVQDWPKGFCDKEVGYMEQTMRLAVNMRQAERAAKKTPAS